MRHATIFGADVHKPIGKNRDALQTGDAEPRQQFVQPIRKLVVKIIQPRRSIVAATSKSNEQEAQNRKHNNRTGMNGIGWDEIGMWDDGIIYLLILKILLEINPEHPF